MDPFTHILGPALCLESVKRPRVENGVYTVWRERAAIILGALLPDADAVPGLLGTLNLTDKDYFYEYHRVVSHSILGLIVISLAAAYISLRWPEKWLFPSLRPKGKDLRRVDPSWWRLWAFAGVAVAFHLTADLMTAWGKLRLFWPFSHRDFQLDRVNSIDPVICAVTIMLWGLQTYFLSRKFHRAGWLTAWLWVFFLLTYVWLRPHFGKPAVV